MGVMKGVGKGRSCSRDLFRFGLEAFPSGGGTAWRVFWSPSNDSSLPRTASDRPRLAYRGQHRRREPAGRSKSHEMRPQMRLYAQPGDYIREEE